MKDLRIGRQNPQKIRRTNVPQADATSANTDTVSAVSFLLLWRRASFCHSASPRLPGDRLTSASEDAHRRHGRHYVYLMKGSRVTWCSMRSNTHQHRLFHECRRLQSVPALCHHRSLLPNMLGSHQWDSIANQPRPASVSSSCRRACRMASRRPRCRDRHPRSSADTP